MKLAGRQFGFTLVELMVAMLLGLLMTGAMLTMLSQARQSFRQDEIVAGMQDESRFAIREISRDLNMAGYMAEMLAPGAISMDASVSIDQDCQTTDGDPWAFSMVDPVSGVDSSLMALDNAEVAEAVGQFGCLASSDIVAGTDIVAIRRMAGSSTAVVEDGDVALRTNGTVGTIFVEPIEGSVPAPAVDWLYTPAIYFIRPYTNALGDGVPSLCRKVLEGGANPTMVTECIAEGIEDLQFEYGIDADGDGSVNVYKTDPTQAELETAISARIFMLARTAEEDRSFDNEKTYVLSNGDEYTPGDNLRRRVYTTTVAIPNLRNRQVLGI